MKYIITVSLLALIAAAVMTYLTAPDLESEVPVIYWVTDRASARVEQVDIFHQWLIKQGHGIKFELRTLQEVSAFRERRITEPIADAIKASCPDGARVWDENLTENDLPLTVQVPPVELRIDGSNPTIDKKLIQGLAGNLGDIIDTYNAGMQMRFLAETGMLADLTDVAKKLGFDTSQTYEGLRPGLLVDGKQYCFPRNVLATAFWVNKEVFEKAGQELPPRQWSIEEFEERGKAFVAAANAKSEGMRVFFASSIDIESIVRSMGLDVFNETLTACALGDPRYSRVLDLHHKWMYKDRIIPSSADMASFAAEGGGWGGLTIDLFAHGSFGLLRGGRWVVMRFRKIGKLQLGAVELPNDGFRVCRLGGAVETVYRNTPNRKFAELFMSYLASEDFNMQIVRDGDCCPPNPKYTETELFNHPPDYPNEWGAHEVFGSSARTIAIVTSMSPFILPTSVQRHVKYAEEAHTADRMSAEEAGEETVRRINADIEQTLKERPGLREEYNRRVADQKKIEELKAQGSKVPMNLIRNPFHRRYYVYMGWADEDT